MKTKSAINERFKAVFRVVSGNFFEMYDFMVYGFYASAIGETFFPSDSAFASLMLSLVTFGAGFLMRPLGALILGAYIDHIGRRKGLILTLGLMALGTFLIACVPGYATIGLAAPLLVLFGRLLQGFAAGVELGGVSIYLSEIAPPGKKGLYVSWQSGSQQIAVLCVAAIGLILSRWLSPVAMDEWGWRIPFLIGCLIVPFLFLIRRSLQETQAFKDRKHRPSSREIYRSMLDNWQLVLTGTLMVAMTTASFYLITAYTPTFGKNVLKLSASDSFTVTACVGLSNFCWLAIWGAISDKVGRKPILLLFSGLAILTAYPAMTWLTQAPTFLRLLGVELWLSLLFGGYNGAMIVALTEIIPVQIRTTGFSLAYSLATAVFGGFTQAIATYLIYLTNNNAAPGLWLSFAAVCGFLATFMAYRRIRTPS